MSNYQNIPELSDKVAIVTGANSGTGYGITYHLAKHGCRVIMASRNERKLEAAREEILEDLPDAKLDIELLDLASLESIERFARRVREQHTRIDFLANNAGGGGSKYARTVDGFEYTLAVNYLGHFAVTTQLLPVLLDGSRIVTFSSIGYKRFLKNHLDVDHLMCESAADFNQMQEYCKAKLCCILFAVKLQREFERIGSSSMSLSCHPGWARTNLFAQSGTLTGRVLGALMNGGSRLLGLSHSKFDGALPAIEALIADDAQPNKVYSPSSKSEMTGPPVARDIDHTHFRDEDIDKLWIKTQEILGIDADTYLSPETDR